MPLQVSDVVSIRVNPGYWPGTVLLYALSVVVPGSSYETPSLQVVKYLIHDAFGHFLPAFYEPFAYVLAIYGPLAFLPAFDEVLQDFLPQANKANYRLGR